MQLDELDTPCLVIDEARMQHNIARMQRHMDALGVSFRPHVKTSKCLDVVRQQRDAGARGITVSTLKEAEEFFDGGFDDIFYAVAMAPNKVQRALALQARGCKLRLVVDSLAGAEAVLAAGAQAGIRPRVLIEVDVDGHRAGVHVESPLLVEIGTRLQSGGADVLGVMSHAGSSYACSTSAALLRIAEQERARSVLAAECLRAAGLRCEVVSVGSTPTALSAQQLDGVTEVRAGVYVFFDLVMAGTTVCGLDEIALSVLTTVIGHQPERGWIMIDAGWMALSRDRGTQEQAVDRGYGMVCDAAGTVLDGWTVSGANQEHGMVACTRAGAQDDIEKVFPIGTRLRILPNHACATAAQHGSYHVLRGADASRNWPRFTGW
jgi:D-serine deaminase-like pyridoxal phosphate-dependent protein